MTTLHTVQLHRLPDGSLMVAEEHTFTAEEMQTLVETIRQVAADVADAARGHGHPVRWAVGGTVQPRLWADPDAGPDGCYLPAGTRSRPLDDVLRCSLETEGRLIFTPTVTKGDQTPGG